MDELHSTSAASQLRNQLQKEIRIRRNDPFEDVDSDHSFVVSDERISSRSYCSDDSQKSKATVLDRLGGFNQHERLPLTRYRKKKSAGTVQTLVWMCLFTYSCCFYCCAVLCLANTKIFERIRVTKR